ncbi:MAG: DUF3427 domain-containing protein [Syntrophales bacterium]|nr:DUF3427 domain-containing protein [Syntrophales bacterium]
MTKSYKMLTLLAMLAADKFPGTISLDDLTVEFMKIVARSAALQKDTQIEYTSRQKIQTLLIKNPIKAWSEGDFFIFDGNYFSSRITVKDTERETFIDMAREIIDWRLAEYLQRETRETDPIPDALQEKAELTLWRPYMRDKIPGLFGMEFSIAVWNVGFVSRDSHLFLLVTIENKSFTENYQYKDRFISPEIFQWQCQNQTKQSSMIGQRISRHREKGIFVHLFVRRGKKIGKNAAPFYYCGDVDFIDWDDSTPITVRWRLKDPVPESLRQTWIEN